MPALRNHHYVPQFYFRRFSRDGKSIAMLSRSSGKVVPQAAIKGQASKTGYYGDEEVESALAELEGAAAAALRRLDDASSPLAMSDEDIEFILIHLSLQRSRTEAARQYGKALHDKFTRLMLEVKIQNDTELAEEKRQLLLGSLDCVEADPIHAQRMEMGVAVEHASKLGDLHPLLLRNTTNRPFIFSDAPVVFYNAFYADVRHRGVLGYETPGLMVFMPLSSSTCLALVDARVYTVRGVRENCVKVRELRDVLALNKLQVHSASHCVYFGEPRFSDYVQAAWEAERKRLTQHAGSVVEAPGRAIETGEDMGEILHGFQPQLPYPLTLSFLKHEVRGDRHFAFSRRSEYPLT